MENLVPIKYQFLEPFTTKLCKLDTGLEQNITFGIGETIEILQAQTYTLTPKPAPEGFYLAGKYAGSYMKNSSDLKLSRVWTAKR